MKYYLALAGILLINSLTHAQETVKRSGNLLEIVFEKFEVLKSDKKVRQGNYTATFKGNTIAAGNYLGGKRKGSWSFYNPNGKVIQIFNYDINKIVFADSSDNKNLKYYMEKTNPTDTLIPPVKIGGSSYGYMPLVMARQDLTRQLHDDFPGARKAVFTHILVVDQNGMLVSHQVKTLVDGKTEKTYTLDDSRFDPEIIRFIPATVNHQPVMSKVVMVSVSVFSGMATRSF